jgi:hypothetical protein
VNAAWVSAKWWSSGVPDKVTALEVWLFDKNDSRAVTKF